MESRGGGRGGWGVIYDPRGTIQVMYSWGLGILSNNLAKNYGLYQGLNIAQENKVQKVIFCEDSLLLIHHMIKGTLSTELLSY